MSEAELLYFTDKLCDCIAGGMLEVDVIRAMNELENSPRDEYEGAWPEWGTHLQNINKAAHRRQEEEKNSGVNDAVKRRLAEVAAMEQERKRRIEEEKSAGPYELTPEEKARNERLNTMLAMKR